VAQALSRWLPDRDVPSRVASTRCGLLAGSREIITTDRGERFEGADREFSPPQRFNAIGRGRSAWQSFLDDEETAVRGGEY